MTTITNDPANLGAGIATSSAAIAAKRIAQVTRQNGARADGLIEVLHQVR